MTKEKSLLCPRCGKYAFKLEPHDCPAAAAGDKRSPAAEPSRAALLKALEESVKLQSHYAELLNIYDGGRRLKFKTAADWIRRLIKTGTLEKDL